MTSSFKRFLIRKNIIITGQRYAIEALSAMAQGLFASLLIGTIFSTLGQQTNLALFKEIGVFATSIKGPAMAVAIGYALQAPPLVLFSLLAVGQAADSLGGAGGPLAVYLVALIACEIGKAVSKETKLDIIVTPALSVSSGVLLAMAVANKIGKAVISLGALIMWATDLQPFIMGVLISVIVGITLTLPISSAAICASLGLTGLAGGAALAGCCSQMVGFAVMSYRSNGISGLVAQGLGTSMLQMANIVKKPIIWLPTILTSAITGPIATIIFKMEMNGAAISSGMGTSGFVGQLGLYSGWVSDIAAGKKEVISGMDWLGMVLISFILPAVITWLIAELFQKKGFFTDEDLKLDL